MKNISLAAAFVLELLAFIYFSVIPFTLPLNEYLQLIFSGVLFVLLVIFWSQYMSPRAHNKFAITGYYLSKFSIYTISAYSIFELTSTNYFLVFVVVVVVDELVLLRHNVNSLS